MKCCLDGRNLVAVADIGSDLNFMSLECAKREGFYIDGREKARMRIRLGDGTEAETIGQVHIYNLSLDWREPITLSMPSHDPDLLIPTDLTSQSDEFHGTIFHVLPGVPHDVILGQYLLLHKTDRFDRFSAWAGYSIKNKKAVDFNILIKLPKLLRQYTEAAASPEEAHKNEVRKER